MCYAVLCCAAQCCSRMLSLVVILVVSCFSCLYGMLCCAVVLLPSKLILCAMPGSAVLCCAVLCCAVLCCAVLCYDATVIRVKVCWGYFWPQGCSAAHAVRALIGLAGCRPRTRPLTECTGLVRSMTSLCTGCTWQVAIMYITITIVYNHYCYCCRYEYCCFCRQCQHSALFNPKTVGLTSNSETSGDSTNTLLHWGDVSGLYTSGPCIAIIVLQIVHVWCAMLFYHHAR